MASLPHRASFNCNKTQGYPKVYLKLIKICHTHRIFALMPKLSSVSSFVPIFFITCRWQTGWPWLCQLPSWSYPVEIPACLCSGMPNYWAIEAHDLWGFLQPYVTKTKAVVAWNQKELKKLWRVMYIFIILIVVRVCGHMHKATYQNIHFYHVNYTPIKLLKTVLTYFLLIIRFINQEINEYSPITYSGHLHPW